MTCTRAGVLLEFFDDLKGSQPASSATIASHFVGTKPSDTYSGRPRLISGNRAFGLDQDGTVVSVLGTKGLKEDIP
jgi:hypothetical protein